MRTAGHWLTWNQKPRQFEGMLLSGRSSNKENEQGVSYIYVADGPKLYNATFKSVFANEIRIVGIENVDHAWVVQEWNCEILAVD